MSYNSDMIIANLEEMSFFLKNAVDIQRELSYQLTSVERTFRSIDNWEDNIHQKTEMIFESINEKCDAIFDEIDRLNNAFKDYLNLLNDYNNVLWGRFGRL